MHINYIRCYRISSAMSFIIAIKDVFLLNHLNLVEKSTLC